MGSNFIVYMYQNGSKSEPEFVHYEYRLGEVINVNSNSKFKCIRKEIVNGKRIHYFKEGIPTYRYDY